MRYSSLLALAAFAGNAAAAKAPAAYSACECVSNKRCWGLVMSGYAELVPLAKREIEGSFPNRFFPASDAGALSRPDKDGHFLRVTCGAKAAPCRQYRDSLERRLAVSVFLQCLPQSAPKSELFDPRTWAIKPQGEAVLKEAVRCRPGLWSELAPVLQSPGP